MGLFGPKSKERASLHPAVHQHLVALSFGHVRKDVENLYEWIRYLHHQNKAQQDLIHHLSRQLQSRTMEKEVREQKNSLVMQEIKHRLGEVEQRVSSHAQPAVPSPASVSQVISSAKEAVGRPGVRGPASSSSLQERVMKKVQRNSKAYIKDVIRQLVAKYARISGTQLREIVVEEQALCSRSSFYRLLGELEVERAVDESPLGKEHVYTLGSEVAVEQIRNL